MAASAQQCCTSFSIRRKTTTDNMLQITGAHPNWLVYDQYGQMTYVDTIMQWREDWSSASVVADPTIRQHGFNLPRHTWSLMNCFRTGQGPCRANLHKQGLTQSPSCDSGQRQTVNHIVDTCPLTKFEGVLNYSMK